MAGKIGEMTAVEIGMAQKESSKLQEYLGQVSITMEVFPRKLGAAMRETTVNRVSIKESCKGSRRDFNGIIPPHRDT